MSYVLLDDGFHSNPKIVRAGLAAAGLYARALSYCGDYLTDGHIAEEWLMGAAGKDGLKVVNELLRHTLIVRENGGFHIPDYLDYQLSKDQVLAKRADKSKAGRKGANKRWGDSTTHNTSDSTSDNSRHDTSHSSSPPEAIARAHGTTNTYTEEERLSTSRTSLEAPPLSEARPPAHNDNDQPEFIDFSDYGPHALEPLAAVIPRVGLRHEAEEEDQS